MSVNLPAKLVDALVIGAGMSGIAAAAKLHSKGINVIVLEAKDRIGGRLYTDRKSGSAPYEFGCSWIHQSLDNPFLPLAQKLGIEVQYDDQQIVLYDHNGPLEASRQLGDVSSQFANFSNEYFDKNDGDISLKELAGKFIESSGTVLSQDQLTTGPNILRLPQLGNGAEDWSQVSARYKSLPVNGRDAMVVGGYDKILAHVQSPLPSDSIFLNTPVESIDVSNKDVVTVRANGVDYLAKYVVVTAPIGVLKAKTIQFIPSIPPAIGKAIDSLSVSFLSKVYIEFDNVFWPPTIDKMIIIDAPTKDKDSAQTFPLVISNYYKFNGQNKYPGLAVLVPPPLSKILEKDASLSMDYLRPALEALREDKSTPVPTPTKITSTKWSVDPYIQGSYSTASIGHNPDDIASVFEKGADRLRFAGEHTIIRGRTYVHGAYRSGQREADYIIGALGEQ